VTDQIEAINMQRRLRKDTNDVVADTEGNKAIAKILKTIAAS
jgi:hypothetical protein